VVRDGPIKVIVDLMCCICWWDWLARTYPVSPIV